MKDPSEALTGATWTQLEVLPLLVGCPLLFLSIDNFAKVESCTLSLPVPAPASWPLTTDWARMLGAPGLKLNFSSMEELRPRPPSCPEPEPLVAASMW